ncbi:hypothetical protein PInf_007830 [Phytophthora infestans]|nr:hypothetical protein PInf_007830 [Phytophthora infestans]
MVKLFCAIVGERTKISIIIKEWKTVASLKREIKGEELASLNGEADKLQLFLMKNKDGTWLDGASAAAVALDDRGHPQGFEKMDPLLYINNDKYFNPGFQPHEGEIHVLVKLPAEAFAEPLPTTTALNDPDSYAEECLSIPEWDVGVVHKIPLLWKFMSGLGGCTNSGEIFWRIEEKQVVSVLVNGWFRASSPSNFNITE